MSLCFGHVYLSISLSVFMITQKLMNESFIWVGLDQRKKWLNFGKDLPHTLDIKTSRIFLNLSIFSDFFHGHAM